VKILGFELNTF